ncbi:MAG: hypothetical protein ACOH5I_02795 [Oligoflexus sp.]
MKYLSHMLAMLLVLPSFACQKAKHEHSLAALKSHIEEQAQKSEQIPPKTTTTHEGEAWITDDMNDGVRPPTAHEPWQSEEDDTTSSSPDLPTPQQSQQSSATATLHQINPLEQADRLMRRGFDQQAIETYLGLCQAGNAEACHRFGYYMSRSGNWQNASRFYQVACANGIDKSCNNLGWVAEKRGDLAMAQDFYSWACLKHHKTSCESLKRVTKKIKNSRFAHPSHQLR